MKKKLVSAMMALAMIAAVTAVNTTKAEASTATWNLRYIQHAESSANITVWTSYLTTTQTTTTMKVAVVGGGAEIYCYTSNGIVSVFSGPGQTSVATPVRTGFYAEAKYFSYGTSNSFPSGSVIY